MKNLYFLIIAVLFSASSVKAQTTEGKEFWITFGSIANAPITLPGFDFQIRIVTGNNPTTGTIYFTNINNSVPFNIGPNKVYTYFLDEAQREAVYNMKMGTTDHSIHITSNEPVSVYILSRRYQTGDATNILPVTALGTEYYQISYTVPIMWSLLDAYAVVATRNNTTLYHNGDSITTLNAGEVYYRTSSSDMTGAHITATHPVAFFACQTATAIPIGTGTTGHILQQLAPVNTWGKRFFVPVTHYTKERVRIVASQNGTKVTQTGGLIQSIPGGQASLNLDAGQWVELEIYLNNNGCFIEADKPVGICSFIGVLAVAYPSQCWISALEQSLLHTRIAHFKSLVEYWLLNHSVLVCTPTDTKNSTKVSIGGSLPTPLTGGSWIDHSGAQMSFYTMPLTNDTVSYTFTNPNGLIILCYGYGSTTTYYYLAGSATRDLDAMFYANDIHFQDLKDTTFCTGAVELRAEIEGELHPDAEHLKWFINGSEYLPARDLLIWNKTFFAGEYEIKMWVRYENGDTISKANTLQVKSCSYAGYYANDIYCADLADTLFCIKTIEFTTVIENVEAMTSLNWYINGTLAPALHDRQTWTRSFRADNYVIKMEVSYSDGTILTYEGDLSIGAQLDIVPVSSDGGETNINGGAPNSGGCFKVGSTIYFNAIPK